MTLFGEIALVVVIAAVLGLAAHLLKQPTILGYLAAGVLINQAGIFDIANVGVLDELAEIGIAFLLFLVGLEMDWTRLKEIGKPAVYTGLAQIGFTFAAGFLITKLLGFSTLSSIYINIALTLSSTIIVIQLLSQKKDLGSLYGKIVVGFLLVQDFVAICALLFLAAIAGLSADFSFSQGALVFLGTIFKAAALLAVTIFCSRKVFPRLLDKLGMSQEILFLFSLAWGLGLAALVSGPWVGFSIEIGGFLAGLSLANSITNFQIASRIKPIRDFFIMLFFVALGSRFIFGDIQLILNNALILSLFVLVGNPLIVMVIMSALGYRSRTSFLASLAVAQISEFSLIIAALGFRLGHLNEAEVSLITLVGIVTIVVSSYFILHGDAIYRFLKRGLKIFEFRNGISEQLETATPYENHIVLVGAHRMGNNILRAIKLIDEEYVVVDFDPLIVEDLKQNKEPVIYGDITDDEIQRLAGLTRARIVISTVPDFRDNLALISFLKKDNRRAKIIVSAENEWEGKELYNRGVDYVILPHFIGGLQIAHAIRIDRDFDYFKKMRQHDLALLKR